MPTFKDIENDRFGKFRITYEKDSRNPFAKERIRLEKNPLYKDHPFEKIIINLGEPLSVIQYDPLTGTQSITYRR